MPRTSVFASGHLPGRPPASSLALSPTVRVDAVQLAQKGNDKTLRRNFVVCGSARRFPWPCALLQVQGLGLCRSCEGEEALISLRVRVSTRGGVLRRRRGRHASCSSFACQGDLWGRACTVRVLCVVSEEWHACDPETAVSRRVTWCPKFAVFE